MQEVRRPEKAGREMVLARLYVLRQAPRRGRYERVRKQIERERQRVGRLRVLTDSTRTRDELTIERLAKRLKSRPIHCRFVGAPEHARGARDQIGGMSQKCGRDQVGACGRAWI